MAGIHLDVSDLAGRTPAVTADTDEIVIDLANDAVHLHGTDEDLRSLAAAITQAVGA